MKKQNKGKNLMIILIISLLILILLCYFIVSNFKINKVLSAKYDNIKCITSDCDGIMATRKIKNKEMVFLLNSKGKIISKYEKKSDRYEPYALSKNYFISSSQNDDKSKTTYVVYNKKGKQIYKTQEKLEKINDDYILISSDNEKYSIVNKDGKLVYSDIKEVNFYNNKKFISAKIDQDYILFNEKLEKVLTNYTVDKEVKDKNDEVLYLIVKDTKSEEYSYFDIKSSKIVGESFSNYKETENEDEYLITRKVNNSKVTYVLYKNGKQKKSENNKSQIELVNDIKSILNKDYYLYTSTVSNEGNKYVLVDNLKENSIGTFNIKTKIYTEIYKYSKTENIYSTVTKLDSKKGLYYQVNCSSKKCDTPVTVVYDLTENKEILKLESNEKIPEKYIQYNNGYKVIKYSKSSNSDYKNKYVLYDKNNKELLSSDNEIVIIDSEIILGENESTTSLVFYFAKEKKKLNDNNGEIITINNNKYYKYSSDKNIIRNSEGKIIFESPKNSSIIYSDTSIMSLDSENITLKNIAYEKTVKYKLDKNETISNNNLEKINPYKNAIYINNTSEKYIKIVNNKGKTIKKIDDATINKVAENSSSNVVIIVKNSKNKYGLLIGE